MRGSCSAGEMVRKSRRRVERSTRPTTEGEPVRRRRGGAAGRMLGGGGAVGEEAREAGGAEGDREGDERARGQRTAAGLRFARFDGGGERRGEPGGESGGVRFDVVRGAREHAQDRDFRERSALSVERKRRLQGGKCELV